VMWFPEFPRCGLGTLYIIYSYRIVSYTKLTIQVFMVRKFPVEFGAFLPKPLVIGNQSTTDSYW